MNTSTQFLISDKNDGTRLPIESAQLRLLRQLYDQAPSAIIAMPFCSILLVLGLKNSMNTTLLLSWLTGVLLLTLARSIVVYLFSISADKEAGYKIWYSSYLVIEFISGLLWASTSLFLPQLDVIHQMFVLFAFGGMLMGATVILAPVISSYIAYAVPSGILFITGLSTVNSELYFPMSVLTALFIVVLIYISFLMYQRIVHTLKLTDQNLQLIEEAKHSNKQLELRIAEKEQMELKLINSRNDLSRIIEHMQDTYYRLDMVGRIYSISPSIKTLLGYEVDELTGTEPKQLFANPKHMDEFLARLQGQDGKIKDFETRLITKDEHQIWASLNAQYYFDKKGNIKGIEGTIRDISQNRITSEAILKSKEEYKTLYEFNNKILENSPVGILTIDENNRSTYLNPALKRIVGAPTDSSHVAEGRDLRTLSSIQQTNDIMQYFGKLTKGEIVHLETPFTSVYGKSIILDIYGVPIFDKAKYSGSLIFITDITEKAREKDFLTSARQQAELDRRSRERFIEKISEELKRSLTDIVGMTDLLLNQNKHPDIADDLKIVYDASSSIVNYVNTINNIFTESESSNDEEKHNKIEIAPLIASRIDDVNSKRDLGEIGIKTVIKDNVPTYIKTNRIWLSRIIDNVFSNLVEQHDRGEVTLTISYSNEYLRLQFEHSNFQIPADIFNVNLNSSSNWELSEYNVNLAVTKQLIESLNGNVHIETGEGNQTYLVIYLPVQAEWDSNKPTHPSPSSIQPVTGLSILVVEDNVPSQTVIRKMLENLEHTPVVVADGNEAIRLISEETFDLILMDINLQGIDGMQTSRVIRELPDNKGNMPIIAVTASSPLNSDKWLEAGIDSYVLKPLSLRSLASAINSAIFTMNRPSSMPDVP